jgi:hypothetical protein
MPTEEARKAYSAWVEDWDENPPVTHRLHYTIEIEMDVSIPGFTDPNRALAGATVPGDIPYRIFESWGYADPPVFIHDDRMTAYATRLEELPGWKHIRKQDNESPGPSDSPAAAS